MNQLIKEGANSMLINILSIFPVKLDSLSGEMDLFHPYKYIYCKKSRVLII